MEQSQNNNDISVVNVTTDREACQKSWYVIRVRPCCEKKISKKLMELGYETFIPTQTEIRQWSDRKKKVERVLIPMMVFLYIYPNQLSEIEHLSYVYEFLKIPGQRKAAVIPEQQIENLKFLIGATDKIEISEKPIEIGDYVRVIRGGLRGLTGYVTQTKTGNPRIHITIDYIGCASVNVNLSDIELYERN